MGRLLTLIAAQLLAVLSACLLLGGCVSLLERSYSVVEPYADRYWDSAAEDTLKAENYQDLVNSLLMQVEQRMSSKASRPRLGAALLSPWRTKHMVTKLSATKQAA